MPADRDKTVLVTGATGLVGRHLVLELSRRGHVVIGTALERPSWWSSANPFVEHDFMRQGTAPLKEPVGCAATVVHACDLAKTDTGRNQDVASDMLRMSRDAGVNRFLYVSSIRVYAALYGIIDERTVPKPWPSDAYGVSKYRIEEALRRLAAPASMELVILRLGNVFSPATPEKFPRPQAWLTRVIYRGMNHHLISTAHVAHATAEILKTPLRAPIEVFNVTQELERENDYFYLSDRLAGRSPAHPNRISSAGRLMRHVFLRLRGETPNQHFSTVLETRLRDYGIRYPESLSAALIRAKHVADAGVEVPDGPTS